MQNKNRWTNIILAMAAIVLVCLCIGSVASPILFDKKRQMREEKVKARLIKIREAQVAFEQRHGKYCPSLDTLVGLGLLMPGDIYVPYSDGMPFELEVDSMRMRTGEYMPLMQCGARFEDYLYGLDEQQVKQLTETVGNAGNYPGLMIGNTAAPNGNAGNWE